MRFILSKRQQKELSGGKVLRIAMPYPDEGIAGAHRHHDGEMEAGDDWQERLSDWVSGVLDTGGVPYDCTWVEIEDVPVDPCVHGGGSLAQVLGQISHGRGRCCLIVRIVCVVAEISARRAPRRRYPTQWPAAMQLPDGRRLPAE
jgi:hypothetical protein